MRVNRVATLPQTLWVTFWNEYACLIYFLLCWTIKPWELLIFFFFFVSDCSIHLRMKEYLSFLSCWHMDGRISVIFFGLSLICSWFNAKVIACWKPYIFIIVFRIYYCFFTTTNAIWISYIDSPRLTLKYQVAQIIHIWYITKNKVNGLHLLI